MSAEVVPQTIQLAIAQAMLTSGLCCKNGRDGRLDTAVLRWVRYNNSSG